MIGGQAPKAIRSMECYDFQEERWYQLAEMPSRRCRCGENFYSLFIEILILVLYLQC